MFKATSCKVKAPDGTTYFCTANPFQRLLLRLNGYKIMDRVYA